MIKKIFGILASIVFLFLLIYIVWKIYTTRIKNHKKRIEQEVRRRGGKIIHIKNCTGLLYETPFPFISNRQFVYKFEYDSFGEKRVGWVRIGGMVGIEWRWNYKKGKVNSIY
ncbi:hypothetical protein SH2C18_24460 [Clostridium sediminicola]|uniref:hypothetical protein n=1 Tax=Clostridium sediminicola TaxID=3114879 RepID=UPI0031F1CEB7